MRVMAWGHLEFSYLGNLSWMPPLRSQAFCRFILIGETGRIIKEESLAPGASAYDSVLCLSGLAYIQSRKPE